MSKRRLHHIRKHTNPILIAFFVLFSFVCIYPFYYTLVLSFNDATDAYRGGIYFFPRVWSLASYKAVFQNRYIINSFLISLGRVLIMSVGVPFICALYAYAITRKELPGRKLFSKALVIPMYFGGGIIPFYILLKGLHLLNTFWVYIIPYLFVPYYVLLFRSYFQDMSVSLREAALIDGANEAGVFFRIMLPVSIPVFAAVALFTAVANWNEWSVGQLFVSDTELLPLATILLQIMKSVTSDAAANMNLAKMLDSASKVSAQSIRYALIIVSTVPILCVYPILQRYFIHGIMIGAVKE